MKARGSLDTVEMIMAFEEAFGTEISFEGSEQVRTQGEMVDLLEKSLWNTRPSKAAQAYLRKMAKEQQRPELAENLEGLWRREQIAAIVREIFGED